MSSNSTLSPPSDAPPPPGVGSWWLRGALAFRSPGEDTGGAHSDAPPSLQGGRQGEDTAEAPSSSALTSRLCLGELQPPGGSDRPRECQEPRAAARGESGCAAGAAPMPGSQLGRHRVAEVEEGLRGGGERGGGARHPPRSTRPHSGAAAAAAGAALRRLASVAGAARRMCCLTLRPRLGARSSGSRHILSPREPGAASSSEHPSPRPGPRPPRPAPRAPPAERPRLPLHPPGLSRRAWRRPRLVAKPDLRRSSLFLRHTQDSLT